MYNVDFSVIGASLPQIYEGLHGGFLPLPGAEDGHRGAIRPGGRPPPVAGQHCVGRAADRRGQRVCEEQSEARPGKAEGRGSPLRPAGVCESHPGTAPQGVGPQ